MDSSALVKVYVDERGSEVARACLDPARDSSVTVSQITPVEVAAAIHRCVRRGTIGPSDARALLERFSLDEGRLLDIVALDDSTVRVARLSVGMRYGRTTPCNSRRRSLHAPRVQVVAWLRWFLWRLIAVSTARQQPRGSMS
jgi:uncharacterized protein with PIN domain